MVAFFTPVGSIALSLLLQINPAGEKSITSWEQVNDALAIPLFQDDLLWDDPGAEIGPRLGWPRESKTNTQSSFRLYPGPDLRILGARPYSLTLYLLDEKPDRISMVFANKGDFDKIQVLEMRAARMSDATPSERREIERQLKNLDKDLANAIDADAESIRKKLSELFGSPTRGVIGQGSGMRERVERWDWNGHAFILSTQDGEYAALRILPKEVAESSGRPERTNRIDLMNRIGENVEKREQGDVVIRQIPMVNQGPKGYCVPATWERYLRYVGVPADMYLLAMAGQTKMGGGTQVGQVAASAENYLRQAGRRSERIGNSLEPRDLARVIDRGLPIMWTMYLVEPLNDQITKRSAARQTVTDWSDWTTTTLIPARTAAREIKVNRDDGHVCMIIGYNATTGEIAISDSWGPAFEERWITLEEAKAISQGDLRVIR